MDSKITYSPRTNVKREPFQMQIAPQLKQRAFWAASQQGRSLSSVVEELLDVFLETYTEENPLWDDDREPNVG